MANELTGLIDNSAQIIEAFNQQVENGMNAIGLKAEGHAKASCPVDTGRLRNSITFATSGYHSPGNTNKPKKTKSPPQDAKPEDFEQKGDVEPLNIYIGTNVEYAKIIEENDMPHNAGQRAHFLRDAAATHSKEYEDTMRAAMES